MEADGRTVPLLFSRAATLAVFVAVTLVVASGVSLALNKVGTNGPDNLRGTNKSDFLSGRGGGDDIYGLGGTDNLQGGPGKQVLKCAHHLIATHVADRGPYRLRVREDLIPSTTPMTSFEVTLPRGLQ